MSGGRQMLAKNQSGRRLNKKQLRARDKPPTSSKAPRSGPSRQPPPRPQRAIAAPIYAGADSDADSDGDSDSDLSCSGGSDDESDCAGSDVDDE